VEEVDERHELATSGFGRSDSHGTDGDQNGVNEEYKGEHSHDPETEPEFTRARSNPFSTRRTVDQGLSHLHENLLTYDRRSHSS